MTRRLIPLLVLCLLLPLLPAPGEATGETFTLMVYLCGTDLESDDGSATDDLLEMLEANLTLGGPVKVLVETGGTVDWWNELIDPDRNERRLLGGDSTSGVCFDEYDGQYLTGADIHDALETVAQSEPGFHLDLVGFDACLMATFEMANYLRDFADYMVASEELAPGYGFDYEAILSALKADPGIDTAQLGRVIADSFLETNLRHTPDDYMTLSVLDMSGMEALTAAMDDIGEGLSVALDSGGLNTISRSRQNMRSFGEYDSDGSDMVDLTHFVDVYAALSGADVSAVRSAIDDVVVYNHYTENNLSNIGGISILMPLKTRSEYADYSVYYDPLNLFPQYASFIDSFVTMLSGGSYVFSPSKPQQSTGWSMLSSISEGSAVSEADAPAASGWALVDSREEEAGTGDQATSGWVLQTTPQDEVTYSGWNFGGLVERIDDAAEPDEEAFGEDGVYTYSLTLSEEDMEYLSYVKGNLMIDVSDDEIEAYVDLGYLQNAVIDWNNSTVYSLFDGSWPMLEDQFMHMTDQIVTEKTRRSLINCWVNDQDVYLLVIFDEKRPNGEIIGYTEGYTESGMPTRGYQQLVTGDIITPQYYLYFYDEDGEEYIEAFDGDPIEYTGVPLSFGYESLVGEDIPLAYTFCLNDVFGDYSFSDFIYFTL